LAVQAPRERIASISVSIDYVSGFFIAFFAKPILINSIIITIIISHVSSSYSFLAEIIVVKNV
jgi:hypothetical protein